MYRHGKREEGEDPASNHQIRSGNGRWAIRRGVGRLNPYREAKYQSKNGDRERGYKEKVAKKEEILDAQTEAMRQSTAAPRATKRNEESITCVYTGDHSCHVQGIDYGGGG